MERPTAHGPSAGEEALFVRSEEEVMRVVFIKQRPPYNDEQRLLLKESIPRRICLMMRWDEALTIEEILGRWEEVDDDMMEPGPLLAELTKMYLSGLLRVDLS